MFGQWVTKRLKAKNYDYSKHGLTKLHMLLPVNAELVFTTYRDEIMTRSKQWSKKLGLEWVDPGSNISSYAMVYHILNAVKYSILWGDDVRLKELITGISYPKT